MASLNLKKLQQTIFIIMLVKIHLSQSAVPGLQTTTYDGIPPNWFANVDAAPFVRLGSKYYYFETRSKANWYDAAHNCRTMKANLVTYENSAEFDAVNDYIRRQQYDAGNYYWTASNDLGTEGKFFSIGTGLPMTFDRFTQGNPDNSFGNENCVHSWFHQGQYSMNDLDCKKECNYVCQAENPKTIAFTVW
ncbi:C-type lectin 37Db-like [Lucilia sericata]|uniref:C-type lectin 37Db-like n=1 Tax=Lucilia sericata TaxID=13632 RepID=UPI0018A8233E|nr:C-type lectin 37Db-like [Lucilia sericata]